jgi:hypothetical protein
VAVGLAFIPLVMAQPFIVHVGLHMGGRPNGVSKLPSKQRVAVCSLCYGELPSPGRPFGVSVLSIVVEDPDRA